MEILVKLSDNDPTGRNPAAYRPGMPVVIKPDGWGWGNDERPPRFFVVKLPGVPIDKIEKYIEEYMVDTGVEEDGLPKQVRGPQRKVWQLRINQLPSNVANRISSIGSIVIGSKISAGINLRWADLAARIWNAKESRYETEDLTPWLQK